MPTQGPKHLVFYDGACGLCDHAVQFILFHDSKALFCFAPLEGETANKLLKTRPDADSLILIENFQSSNPEIYILGKGALRILWGMGGIWALPGALSFLPSFLYDWIYRLVAKNRRHFFSNSCILPKESNHERFLS